MEDAKKVISEITEATTKCSVSRKDEVTVMKAIINDPNYSVNVYGKPEVEEYHPGGEFRKVVTNAITDVTKMPKKEVTALLDDYEFSKSDASAMVDLSKQFVLSYLQTGRKLAMGVRDTSAVELSWRNIPERESQVPGNGERATVTVPSHDGIKASNPCPKHLKNK